MKPRQLYTPRIMCELRLSVPQDQAIRKRALLRAGLIFVFQTTGTQDIHKRCCNGNYYAMWLHAFRIKFE
jgi:hypothetical protein